MTKVWHQHHLWQQIKAFENELKPISTALEYVADKSRISAKLSKKFLLTCTYLQQPCQLRAQSNWLLVVHLRRGEQRFKEECSGRMAG